MMTTFIAVVLLVLGFLCVSLVVIDWERACWMVRCAKAEKRVAELEQQLADRPGVSA